MRKVNVSFRRLNITIGGVGYYIDVDRVESDGRSMYITGGLHEEEDPHGDQTLLEVDEDVVILNPPDELLMFRGAGWSTETLDEHEVINQRDDTINGWPNGGIVTLVLF